MENELVFYHQQIGNDDAGFRYTFDNATLLLTVDPLITIDKDYTIQYSQNRSNEIYEIPAKRVIGLTNSPTKLNEIREERLKALGLPKGSSYASMERILDEIDYAEKIMKRIGCPILDVSNKAIEETAELIISILKRNGVKIFKD